MKFTKEELYWIERTADIESSLAMERFIKLAQTDITNLNKKEIETLKNMGSEFVDLYTFLKELRIKLEIERKHDASHTKGEVSE